MNKTKILFLSLALALVAAASTFPCSMVVVGNCDEVVTGRTMDFFIDMQTKISLIPAGTSFGSGSTKYNFLSFNAFGFPLPGHGINEKGLSVSYLWLNPTSYPQSLVPGINYVSILQFAPLVLGTMSSVDEVEAFFRTSDIDFVNVAPELKKLDLLHQHLYFVDSKGHTLIVEWLEGKRYMYRDESPVLVNDPPFAEQKKIWAKQLETKSYILNYEYNLIGAQMHDADSRYEMLMRMTEQSLPTKGFDNITKAFQLMKRVNYYRIKPYLNDGPASWTLYTAVFVHTADAVKVYWTDDLNDAVRCIDFNKVAWRDVSFPIEAGPGATDMSAAVAAY